MSDTQTIRLPALFKGLVLDRQFNPVNLQQMFWLDEAGRCRLLLHHEEFLKSVKVMHQTRRSFHSELTAHERETYNHRLLAENLRRSKEK